MGIQFKPGLGSCTTICMGERVGSALSVKPREEIVLSVPVQTKSEESCKKNCRFRANFTLVKTKQKAQHNVSISQSRGEPIPWMGGHVGSTAANGGVYSMPSCLSLMATLKRSSSRDSSEIRSVMALVNASCTQQDIKQDTVTSSDSY